MKIFKGRVAPPYVDASLGDYPTSKFFFENFFLFLFYMLNFVKLCFIVYEVCIFVVFLSMICYG